MSILDQIIAHKRREVERLSLSAESARTPAPRGFARRIRNHTVSPAVIAEFKRASPSKGDIAPGVDPVEVAGEYLENGAAALSILTDSHFFKGTNEDLQAVRAAYPDAAILRKDFIIDSRQVAETRAIGADAILLILAALDDAELRSLALQSWQAGLDILFEVHDEFEVDRLIPVLKLAPEPDRALFGVNNRDLKTFEVDLNVTRMCIARLRESGLAGGVICVGESGIRDRHDIETLAAGGAGAFLIGESLIRNGAPGTQLAKLLERR